MTFRLKLLTVLVGLTTFVTSSEATSQLKLSTAKPDKAETKVKQTLVCDDCSENEQHTLTALQERGITDINAVATVMGNIKQESKFDPVVCEGGKRTGYHGCHRGGFGIIQFTTHHRYYGLGRFARERLLNPSHLTTQLNYMFHEKEWKLFEPHLKKPGRTVEHYMGFAKKWLGWGVFGKRAHYAYDYAKRLKLSPILA